jgi:hypothetical protein
VLHQIRSLTRLGCSEPVSDESLIQRISSLTSLCFSESVHSKFALQRICSLMTLRSSRISSLTRLCGAVNPFANEYVHHRISSLTGLWFTEFVRWQGWGAVKQFADESVLQRISSLWVFFTANQFNDDSMCQRNQVANEVVRCSESGCWWVCASPN